jgi:hypothetical protein
VLALVGDVDETQDVMAALIDRSTGRDLACGEGVRERIGRKAGPGASFIDQTTRSAVM